MERWLRTTLLVSLCFLAGMESGKEALAKTSAQARRKGVRACKAFLLKHAPELLPKDRPSDFVERFAALYTIFDFLRAHRTELPPECEALVRQATELIDSRSE